MSILVKRKSYTRKEELRIVQFYHAFPTSKRSKEKAAHQGRESKYTNIRGGHLRRFQVVLNCLLCRHVLCLPDVHLCAVHESVPDSICSSEFFSSNFSFSKASLMLTVSTFSCSSYIVLFYNSTALYLILNQF